MHIDVFFVLLFYLILLYLIYGFAGEYVSIGMEDFLQSKMFTLWHTRFTKWLVVVHILIGQKH